MTDNRQTATYSGAIDPTKPLTAHESDKQANNRPGQFQPGQSGNPHGRPKKEWTMTYLIEESLEEADETGISYKRIIANKLRSLAVSGDLRAIKEIFDEWTVKPNSQLICKRRVIGM